MLSGCETVEPIDEHTAVLENFKGMDDKCRESLVAAVNAISGPGLEYDKRRV